MNRINNLKLKLILFSLGLGLFQCTEPIQIDMAILEEKETQPNFEEDLNFLRKHNEVILLSDSSSKAQIAVVPTYQGRVMTSTALGPKGVSFGWINRELIASGKINPHINAYGGEDRFWMGPEGGQFSIFFKPGDPFDLEHWQTPAVIDSVPYAVVALDDRKVSFRHQAEVVNYSETRFNIQIDRTIELLDRETVSQVIGNIGTDVPLVSYRTINTITNQGIEDWNKDQGLLSIWILGMFKSSPTTTVVIPYTQGSEEKLGPIVNDNYFGDVPDDRLVITDNHIFFKTDGAFRSKIGITPQRSRSISGSYDWKAGLVTIAHFQQPSNVLDYVNSMWKIQEDPYRGDVINSYNDGPPSPSYQPLSSFYEIETSSPAAVLRAGESITHIHTTIHLTGVPSTLDPILEHSLGVNSRSIRNAFGSGE